MDYLQIYKEEYDKVFEKKKKQAMKIFKVAKDNDDNYKRFFDEMNNNLKEEKKSIIEDFENRNLKKLFEIFEQRYEYLNNNLSPDVIINKIFEKKILSEYKELGFTNYKQFIEEIAALKSIEDIRRHFYNNFDYYKLIYELDKYEYFYLNNNNYYKSSKEYNEMKDIKYPDRHPDFNNTELKESVDAKKNIDLNKEDQKIIAEISLFTKEEKLIMLATLLDSVGSNNQKDNEKNERIYGVLPLSEYMRILAITKDLINYETFYKAVGKVSIYQELNKKTKIVNPREIEVFLLELNKKLEHLNISKFQVFIYKFLKRN